MSAPILATKLFVPPPRPKIVLRPRLIERLNEGLHCKLTLISASAGFGKTTLVSEWISTLTPCPLPLGEGTGVRVAWLSLDEGDNDPTRFLTYLVAALQTIMANIGAGVLAALQTPQLPSIESILTILLNEITTIPDNFVLVLDDYHVIDSKPVDEALTFLLKHLPPQMHLVIATREDPHLPLARLRARGQLTELRTADLRFTSAEAAEFLNQVMGLNLAVEDIAALETRTEGWIAGLQLAALSMQGHQDTTSFIQSFTGSHHFVLDYLIEEVLQQQPESIQTFLLRTSILDRMCGPLCDAVLGSPSASGQETLEYLERANLFIVPLDNERHWFRYHHLFADLLRQRLQRISALATEKEKGGVDELHRRASQWYEDNALEIEAFHHAAAANDIERAERLITGGGIPLHSLPAVTSILDWLDSLPKTVLDARPWLWVKSAMSTIQAGKITGVEEKLHAAEAALAAAMQNTDLDDKTRDLIGQIAAVKATLANLRYQPEAAIIQARRALEYLHPDNPPFRSRAFWMLGSAYQLQGDRAAARQAYTEAIAIRQTSGNITMTALATTGLGQIQESENQLCQAAETYQRSLQMLSDQGPPNASEEYLGLARIYYEWNDLETAERYGQLSLQLARQYDRAIDRFVICEVFLARLKLARGEVAEAAAILAQADQSVRQQGFVQRIPEVAAAQVITLLRQDNLAAAVHLAQMHELPLSQARVYLAQGDTAEALAVLEPCRRLVEAKGWADERLKTMILQAVALHTNGEKNKAVQLLGEALTLAEPGGFIRIFVDEGAPMAQLLLEAASHGVMPDYISKLLAVFEAEQRKSEDKPDLSPAKLLIESLSQRELKILQLIAQGLSNREISERLFLALDTVKGHNRKMFDKLQVQSRTEAIARARELGLL